MKFLINPKINFKNKKNQLKLSLQKNKKRKKILFQNHIKKLNCKLKLNLKLIKKF